MNKLFFSLILFFAFTLSVQAQINKGNWLLGGEISGGSSNQKDAKADTLFGKSNHLTLTPRVGWFVGNHLVIGLSPGYGQYWSEANGSNIRTHQTKSFTIAPFIRYYKPLNDKWAVFGDFTGISIGFSSSKEERTFSPRTFESSSQNYQLGVFVRPGVTYFISPKIGIEASLGSIGYGYSHTKRTIQADEFNPEREEIYNSFNGGVNLSAVVQNISIGLHIYLP